MEVYFVMGGERVEYLFSGMIVFGSGGLGIMEGLTEILGSERYLLEIRSRTSEASPRITCYP